MPFIFGGDTPWTYEQLKSKQKISEAMMKANEATPRNVGEGIAAIGRALASNYIDKRAGQREGELKSDFAKQYESAFAPKSTGPIVEALTGIQQPQAPQVPDAAPVVFDQPARRGVSGTEGQYRPGDMGASNLGAVVGVQGGEDVAMNAPAAASPDYFGAIKAAESGGDVNAANPRSSARGLYQFTEGTWSDMARKHPELGLTPDGRSDPAQQEAAIRAFTADNATALSTANIPVNDANLYAAHFLGAGGARQVLKSDPSAPMASVVSRGVIEANPFLANMSVGDFQNWTASKVGGGTVDRAAPTPTAQTPDMQELVDLLSNPYATDAQKAVLGSMLQQQLAANTPQPDEPMTRQVTGSEAEAMGLDPSKSYNVKPDGTVTAIGGGGVTVNTGETTSAGWEAIDKKFADSFLETGGGGGADTAKQIAQLSDVLDKLDAGEELTGPVLGLTPDIIKNFTNPEAIQARDQVEEVVQRNLKAILGAQFTREEGNRLIARAYNESLRPEQNAVRLRALIKQMQSAADAKMGMMKHFQEKGTLRGYDFTGGVPSVEMFDTIFDQLDSSQGVGSGNTSVVELSPAAMKFLE